MMLEDMKLKDKYYQIYLINIILLSICIVDFIIMAQVDQNKYLFVPDNAFFEKLISLF